jgi:hypothetical protein
VLDQDLRAKLQLTRVLMHRAVELTFKTAVIAAMLCSWPSLRTLDKLGVTADGKLFKALEGTPYARLAHPWPTPTASSPARPEDRRRTATVLQPG